MSKFKHVKKEIVYIKAGALCPLQDNPRKVIDQNQKEKLAGQIKKHDFQNPLNVYQEENGDYSILCGNHRFAAGKEFMNEFPCIIYTGSKKDAIARAIADNKTSEWTEFDIPILMNMLSDLDEGEFDMEKTAFDVDEIEGFFDFRGEEIKEKEIDDLETKHKCPGCGYEW